MNTAVELAIDGAVARVTLRGEKGIQILSAETRSRLSQVLDDLAKQPTVHVAVFRAEGRTFIAGADIQELNMLTVETAEGCALDGQRLMMQIAQLPQVTIAAVHATCAGGGCELALACDMRMAAAAARIGLPEVSLGLLPGWGGTVRATRLFGGAAARRMILTGELLPAEEALKLGIIDGVFGDAEFQQAVDQRVELILSRGPAACRAVKRLIADFTESGMQEQFQAEARAFAECYATGEPAEGLAAFLEKRIPEWNEPKSSEPL